MIGKHEKVLLLLGACVAAEVAALGLAVVVVVRSVAPRLSATKELRSVGSVNQRPEHEKRRGLFQSFASPRFPPPCASYFQQAR